jgi:hypothetical protein
MKPKSLFATFVALLLLSLAASGQKKSPDACSLISEQQLTTLLGTRVQQFNPDCRPDHCAFKTRGGTNGPAVAVEYFNYNTISMASEMMKMSNKSKSDDVKRGKNGSGMYTDFKAFAAGGPNSYYVSGTSGFGKLVYCEFILGTYLVTVETSEADIAKVTSKLDEIYKIIKGNFH